MRFLEDLLDNAATSLKTLLPAQITVINGEHTDFVLPTPGDDDYHVGGLATYLRFPAVEIAAPDWSIGSPSVGQRHWSGASTVMVRVIWQHPDFDTLHRGTLRYGRCLVECLSQPDVFGTGQTVQSMRGFFRVNPETGERSEFMAGALVVCTLDVVEVAPS